MHAYGRSIKACSIISNVLISADYGVVSRQVNRNWEVISRSPAKYTLSHCCRLPVPDTSMTCSQTHDILESVIDLGIGVEKFLPYTSG